MRRRSVEVIASIGLVLLLPALGFVDLSGQQSSALSHGEQTSAPDAALARVGLANHPRIQIKYYDVYGSSVAALRRAMDRNGPLDEEGRRCDALLRWHVTWSWPIKPDRSPRFERIVVRAKYVLQWPRYTNPRSLEVLPQWHRFLEAMALHERTHFDLVETNLGRIADRILEEAHEDPNLSATAANKVAEEVIELIRNANQAYDKVTQHGQTEGVHFGSS